MYHAIQKRNQRQRIDQFGVAAILWAVFVVLFARLDYLLPRQNFIILCWTAFCVTSCASNLGELVHDEFHRYGRWIKRVSLGLHLVANLLVTWFVCVIYNDAMAVRWAGSLRSLLDYQSGINLAICLFGLLFSIEEIRWRHRHFGR